MVAKFVSDEKPSYLYKRAAETCALLRLVRTINQLIIAAYNRIHIYNPISYYKKARCMYTRWRKIISNTNMYPAAAPHIWSIYYMLMDFSCLLSYRPHQLGRVGPLAQLPDFGAGRSSWPTSQSQVPQSRLQPHSGMKASTLDYLCVVVVVVVEFWRQKFHAGRRLLSAHH